MAQRLEFRLEREDGHLLFYCNFYTIFNTICFSLTILDGICTHEFRYNNIVACLVFYSLLLIIYYRIYGHKIKIKFVQCYGVKYKAEIIGCRFVKGRVYRGDQYYLEIAYTDNTGKGKIYKTLGYYGNPNWYLESTHCSIYEWKGMHVEGDFRVREQMDPFGNIGVYCRKVHFTLR